MKRLRFKKLDAFASSGSSGNPAAAVYLDSLNDLSDAEMQRVARELKGFVSEVGFLAPLGASTFQMRYFSSEKEVAFCGHATIAILYDLIQSDPNLKHCPEILLHTPKGVLPVENRIATEDAVHVQAPAPIYRTCEPSLSEICAALNLAGETVDADIPLGIVDAGNRTLCLGLKRLEDVLDAAPDLSTLRTFCDAADLDVVIIHTRHTADVRNQMRTRVFAAPFGYLEDPATGSGNAALGYHLHRLGLWDGQPLRIEQNASREQSNLVRLASTSSPDFRVSFGGGALLRIEGAYCLNTSERPC